MTTLLQMYHALLVTTTGMPTSTIIVPADNVSIAGLTSDMQMISQNDPNYIRPVDGTNFQVSTTTVEATSTRLFLDTPALYDVFKQPSY